MKIVVIGASGFLGTKLFNFLSKNHEVIGTYSDNKKEGLMHLDATIPGDIKKFLNEKKPDLCRRLNYETAKNILEACKTINSVMVFFSSTYIFDGKKGNYNESDLPNPENEYGKTKVLAEKEILSYKNSIVIRVDAMYGYNGKGEKNGVFGGSILSGNEVKLKAPDQMRQPVLADDVVSAILFILKKNQRGLFHVAGPTRVKMIDFLKSLEKVVRDESKISSIQTNEKSEIEMKIPFNTTLDISKIENLGLKTHSFEEGLEILRNQYNKDK